jgi:NADH:ubiquinone oxidoreductase subunit C
MNENIKSRILEIVPEATFEDGVQWLNVLIDSEKWGTLAKELRVLNEFLFDYLFCVTCVDWKTHLSMVYHLSSSTNKNIIVVKAKISDRENPFIDSVSSIWRTAELHEREAYDLFGVRFNNHPDLRRLFLTEDWVGWPLRKDYEDPINMIKL